jgi:TFIIF-interacting CTD phosphatase-like protein
MMNLILDMDLTLIKHTYIQNNIQIIPRPYLPLFFSYIFTHFNNISIWTHSTDEWYNNVYEKLLKHIIPQGKSFHFVWTRNKCIEKPIKTGLFSYQNTIIKPLNRVFSFYNEYNTQNTLIIDDTVSTYQLNVFNAIPIKPFLFNNDEELLRIIQILEYKIKLYKIIDTTDTLIDTTDTLDHNIEF